MSNSQNMRAMPPKKSNMPTSFRAIFYDPKIRAIVFQVTLVLLLGYAFFSIVQNTKANLEARGIASGFDFLKTSSGFGINQVLVEYTESSPYSRALYVGFLNTLLVAALGIVFATVLGFLLGIMRLSKNIVISSIATIYVEVIRNIPLLLQILFIYTGVLKLLPSAKQSLSLGDMFFLNIKGFYMPAVIFGEGAMLGGIAFILAVGACIFLSRWARKRQASTGQQFPIFKACFLVLITLPFLGFALSGFPLTVDYAQLKGFNFTLEQLLDKL